MNINSPVFIPLQLTQTQQHVAAVVSSCKSPLGSPTATTATSFASWQLLQANISSYSFIQQQQQQQQLRLRQQSQQQQYFYHQQRNFYNPNFHYQWPNMAQQQQQQQKKQLQLQLKPEQQQQKKPLQPQPKQQQQQQQHKKKFTKPSAIRGVPKATKISTATKLKTTLQSELEASSSSASLTATATKTAITTTTKTKNDTMQRNGSKASQQTAKSHQQHGQPQQHAATKHDSSDSGISTHGAQHAAKSRKGGRSSSSSKRHGDSGNTGKNATAASAAATAARFSVDDWLGRDMVYCYDRRYIASCAEDNMMPRHNNTHRNSTSSDMAASDDLNTSSSNEDLSAAYRVISKSGKKSAKSRQKRQQKRGKQQGNQANAQDNTPMDVDEELKENRRPSNNNSNSSNNNQHSNSNSNNGNQQQQQTAKQATANLRKQCTKAAAMKQLTGGNKTAACATGGKSPAGSSNAHALTNSPSSSSVCSSLSSASSTSSIPSSVSSSADSTPAHSAHSSPTASPTISKRNAENFKKIARALAPPLRQHLKLNLSEQQLVHQLRRYIIDPNLLRIYGFPVESAIHEGCIEIYKCLPKPFTHHTHHHHAAGAAHNHSVHANVINANDGLHAQFPPGGGNKQWSADSRDSAHQLSSGDSGQGSGDSSPPSVDSDSSEVGEDEPATTTAFYTPDGSYQIFSQYDQSLEKQCVRCKSAFHVTETGEYLSQEECVFHWGKLNHMYTGSKGFAYQYSCCEGDQASIGCTRNRLHVWTGAVVGINGPYTDFVHTRPRSKAQAHAHAHTHNARATKVYALDCEMSFTGLGLEVTKVTVVGYDGQLVYEHFVRPDAEIVDYNTRFSGISAQDLCSPQNCVKTLQEVQSDLLQLIDADTILIGHALDNDLRVLRIVHKTVIDTSVAFPHASGFPYRRALKHLTKVCLSRDIQCGDAGHSSFEDSRACLELMLWKVRKEMRHDDWTQ